MKFNKKIYKLSVRCVLGVCVTIATIVLLLTGNSIGYINSLKVFAAFSICGLIVICIEFVYILGVSTYKTHRSRAANISRRVVDKTINFEVLKLSKKERLQQAFDHFLLQNKLENICESSAEQRSRIPLKETYVVQYADLMTDLFMFAIYLTILTLIVLSSRDSFAFYSTRATIRQFMSRRYFYNETREPIHNELFMEYLENDFFPTIHRASDNKSSNGWLQDHRMKILGVARLRQQRVKKESCKSKGISKTSNLCLPMLEESTEDRTNYNPSWEPQTNLYSKEKYWRILQPWIYQNSYESHAMPQFGKSVLYSAGGYVCNLGRTLANSLLITASIKKQNWIDRQTRVIFIEFTTYGVDSNIFNVITLIAERTQIGYFELTYNIQSVQLITIIENLTATTIIVFMSYVIIISIFIWRIVLIILQSNLRQYFSQLWNIVDLIIVAQSIGIVTIFFVRNQYVRTLLARLEETRNNEFVSFVYAAFLDQFMLWWSGVLVCISTIRVWKILNFIFIFRVFSTTLVKAAKDMFASTVLTLLFFTCFGMLFYLLNSSTSASFVSVTKSFSSLIAILFGFITDRLSSKEIFSGSNWIELLLFLISLGVIAIYMMNMIVTISCNYFSSVRTEAKSIEKEKFSFCDFLREEYANMFGTERKTSRKSKDSKLASVVRSKERLVNLEKRFSRIMRMMEELLQS